MLLSNFLIKIRPAKLQEFLINIFYGKSLNRRKFYYLRKYKISLFLDPFSHLGDLLLKEGVYETDTTSLITQELKKDSIFFDIGANEGFFSIIASKFINTGKIYSFEPLTELLPIIEKNFLENNCKNYEIINIGIGEKSYTTKINIFPSNNTGASSIQRKYKILNKTQLIEIMSLDEFVDINSIYNQIDLIKIDVEGYEIKVIEGMKNLLTNKRINTIILDYHMTIITHQKREECEKFILSCGYEKINTKSDNMICYKLIVY